MLFGSFKDYEELKVLFKKARRVELSVNSSLMKLKPDSVTLRVVTLVSYLVKKIRLKIQNLKSSECPIKAEIVLNLHLTSRSMRMRQSFYQSLKLAILFYQAQT